MAEWRARASHAGGVEVLSEHPQRRVARSHARTPRPQARRAQPTATGGPATREEEMETTQTRQTRGERASERVARRECTVLSPPPCSLLLRSSLRPSALRPDSSVLLWPAGRPAALPVSVLCSCRADPLLSSEPTLNSSPSSDLQSPNRQSRLGREGGTEQGREGENFM